MWGVIGDIAAKLIGSVLVWAQAWFEKERGEAAEWEAKAKAEQLRAVQAGVEAERAILQDANGHIAASTPSEWNRRHAGMITLLLILPLLGGCFRFYVAAREYHPELPLPDAPVLEETVPFTEREKQLVDYAGRIETVIRSYNRWAKQRNEEAGVSMAP